MGARVVAEETRQKTVRWAHRLAWALWATTFPLIWMGGFVTTYDAGMAVPDWPNTYGYNLFLYPIESWLKTWDVFLEHSHRLIASAAGFLSIALMVLLWRTRSSGFKRLGIAVFILVCLQGVIGGLRVLGQELLLANLHGCIAPLFFGLVTAVVVLTAQTLPRQQPGPHPSLGFAFSHPAVKWRFILAACIYVQIILGAQLRHLPPTLPPTWAFWETIIHLVMAGFIGLLLVLAWWSETRDESRLTPWWLPLVTSIYILQVILGLLTWVVNYNFPIWFFDYFMAIPYTVVKGGAAQAVITTAHSATGSLLLAATIAGWLSALLQNQPGRTNSVRDVSLAVSAVKS